MSNRNRPIHGFLVDPYAQKITRVEFPGFGTRDMLNWMYQMTDCTIVEASYFDENGDAAFVDEEGLINGKPLTHFFYIEGMSSPCLGKGLVLGCDDAGNSVSPRCTLEWLQSNTAFVERLMPGVIAVASPISMADRVRGMFAR